MIQIFFLLLCTLTDLQIFCLLCSASSVKFTSGLIFNYSCVTKDCVSKQPSNLMVDARMVVHGEHIPVTRGSPSWQALEISTFRKQKMGMKWAQVVYCARREVCFLQVCKCRALVDAKVNIPRRGPTAPRKTGFASQWRRNVASRRSDRNR